MIKGLGGLGGLGDIGKMMGQMRELQEKMAELKERIDAMEVEGRAGGGMVTAVVTGKGVLKRLVVDPSLMAPDEKAVLEDLVVAAVADAQEKAQERAQEEMQAMAPDLPLPPGMMGS